MADPFAAYAVKDDPFAAFEVKSATPYVADSPLAHHLNEQEGSGDWGQNLANASQSLAHPQTAGDIAGLLIPSGGAEVIGRTLAPVGRAISKYGGAAAKLAGTAATALIPHGMVAPAKAAMSVLGELNPSEWNSPFTVAGREGRAAAAARAFNDLPLAEQMRKFPTTSTAQGTLRTGTPMRAPGNEVAPVPPPAPTGPHMDLSRPIQPGSLTQQQILERARAVQQAGGTSIPPSAPMGPIGGRLQMMPTERPPMTVAPESPMQPPSPMQQPRVQVGAEVVGRQNGLTTQQVRDTTGPIRGEAQGAAAGMPNGPMDRIVQKLIDMGPKGQGLPETARESYAAAATSDKARLQVQAYLDALRKVGFVGAGAASADAIRQAVMKRLQGEQQ